MDLIKNPPTPDLLGALLRKLGMKPRDVLRARDPAYARHDLGSGRHTDAQLLELMAANPGLIQRPIVVSGRRAVVARPAEAAAELIE